MVPAKAIDGDMKTRWGGKARGEWYQLDWDTPHALCGAVIHNYSEVWNKNIPFTLQVWDPSSNGGAGGFRDVQTITTASATVLFQFPAVTTTKLRVNNVITFWEIEVYDDPEVVSAMAEAAKKMEIAVAGDLQGHLGQDAGGLLGADGEQLSRRSQGLRLGPDCRQSTPGLRPGSGPDRQLRPGPISVASSGRASAPETPVWPGFSLRDYAPPALTRQPPLARSAVEGGYWNVVGLPVALLLDCLEHFGGAPFSWFCGAAPRACPVGISPTHPFGAARGVL